MRVRRVHACEVLGSAAGGTCLEHGSSWYCRCGKEKPPRQTGTRSPDLPEELEEESGSWPGAMPPPSHKDTTNGEVMKSWVALHPPAQSPVWARLSVAALLPAF